MKKLCTMILALVLALSLLATASAATMLQQGDRGESVRQLQRALVNQGWADLRIDGIYGPATAAAVAFYQRANGMSATGRAGTQTLQKLLGISEVELNPDGSSNMTEGSSGARVRAIQQQLKNLGYPVGNVDGKYGPQTVAAVRIFQQLNGLRVDGKVGTNTYAMLYSVVVVPYHKVVTYPKLMRGSSGTEVVKLQNALAALGLYAGIATGYYNYATQAAVQAFQTLRGLKVDGIAGQQTLAALYGK